MRVIAGRFVERTSSSPFFCIFINTYYYTIIDARPQTPRGQSVTIDNHQKFRKERNITSTQMKIDSGSGTGSVTPERVAAIKRGESGHATTVCKPHVGIRTTTCTTAPSPGGFALPSHF
ncbi:hypothetical protein E4U12_001771 [Claviceps purpurea]|nr:hypothetical protein E4U12_001771 [Claviceps purpurea]